MSRFGGKGVRLFRFQLQNMVWLFAQADRVVTVGDSVWQPGGIERDEIKQNNERAQDKLKIRMDYLRDSSAPVGMLPATQGLGDVWHPYVPSSTVRVSCYTLDAAGVLNHDWSGEVRQPKFTDVELELTCVPGNSRGEARNQGMKFQRSCPKTVYSTGVRGCNLNPAAFTIAAVLTGASGLTLTAAEFATAPHSLLQGWLSWTRPNGIVERRTIIQHSGNQVRLLYGGQGLANGLPVTVLPNCPGTFAACEARRADPKLHYGGAIYEPIENPHEGGSMSWG
ncbi:MAG TPA: phage BR0599 family protein [Pseudoxanthomonas sp.]